MIQQGWHRETGLDDCRNLAQQGDQSGKGSDFVTLSAPAAVSELYILNN